MFGYHPLIDMCFGKIFSESVAFLLILLQSFIEQKLLIKKKIQLSISSFFRLCFLYLKVSSNPRSSIFSPTYLIRVLQLYSVYLSVVYFEFIFVKRIKSVSRFIYLSSCLFCMWISIFQHHLFKQHFFSSNYFHLLSKVN